MSSRHRKIVSRALLGPGVLLAGFLTVPQVQAGGAAILVPEEDTNVPQGSQIAEDRLLEVERAVDEYMQEMRRAARAQREQAPRQEAPAPAPPPASDEES